MVHWGWVVVAAFVAATLMLLLASCLSAASERLIDSRSVRLAGEKEE